MVVLAPADRVTVLVVVRGGSVVVESLRVVDHPADVRTVVGRADLERTTEGDLAVRALGLEQLERGAAVVVPARGVRHLHRNANGVRDPDARRAIGVVRHADGIAGLVHLEAHDVRPRRAVGDERRHVVVGGAARRARRAPHVEGAVALHGTGHVAPHGSVRVRTTRGLARVSHEPLVVVTPAGHPAVRDPDSTTDRVTRVGISEARGRRHVRVERTGRVAPDVDLAVRVQREHARHPVRGAVAAAAEGERAVGLLTRRRADRDVAAAPAHDLAVGGESTTGVAGTVAAIPDHPRHEVRGAVGGDAGEGLALPATVDVVLPRAVVVQPRHAQRRVGRDDLHRTVVRQFRDALRLELLDRHTAGVALLRLGGGVHEGQQSDLQGRQGMHSKASK